MGGLGMGGLRIEGPGRGPDIEGLWMEVWIEQRAREDRARFTHGVALHG